MLKGTAQEIAEFSAILGWDYQVEWHEFDPIPLRRCSMHLDKGDMIVMIHFNGFGDALSVMRSWGQSGGRSFSYESIGDVRLKCAEWLLHEQFKDFLDWLMAEQEYRGI